MATVLNAHSTLDDIHAAYVDNADYDADGGDTAKAQLFVKAVRMWLLRSPQRATHGGRGGEEVQLPVAQMMDQLKRAEDWLEAVSAEGNTAYLDFSEYRS